MRQPLVLMELLSVSDLAPLADRHFCVAADHPTSWKRAHYDTMKLSNQNTYTRSTVRSKAF